MSQRNTVIVNSSKVLFPWHAAIYFAFLLCATIYIYKKPAYNGDMLPYMALLISADHKEINEIHSITYSEARKHMPAEKYALLADTSHHFRKKVVNDAVMFYQQLPYYIVKPLYVGMAYLCYKAGCSLITSVFLPGVLCFFLTGTLLFFWLGKYLSAVLQLFISIAMCLASPLIHTAELATPDMVSAFILFLAFYYLIEKRREYVSFLLLCLSVFARIDNILICVLILFFAVFSNKWPKQLNLKKFAIAMMLLGGCYMAVAYGATLYGWDMFFISSIYSRHDDTYFVPMASSPLKNFILLRHSAVMVGMLVYHLFIYLCFSLLIFIGNKSWRWKDLSFDQAFIVIIYLLIGLRSVIYTDLGDRHFIAYYLIILILLVRKLNAARSAEEVML